MIPKLYLFGAIGLVILVLSGYGWFEHTRYQTTKAEYDGFVAKAQAIAAQQLAENARKDKEYADKIHSAESARDAALGKLRDSQASTSRLRSTLHSLSASRSGQVCFSASGFDAFLSANTGLIEQGQGAIIDSRALLQSWPE